jgi:ABC-type bacteriocin/lantibiotic exporter with double-glycine peptidase domain
MRRQFLTLAQRVSAANRAQALFDAGVQTVNVGAYSVFVVMGAAAVGAGTISVGTYVASIGLVLFVSSPLVRLMLIWDDVQATLSCWPASMTYSTTNPSRGPTTAPSCT